MALAKTVQERGTDSLRLGEDPLRPGLIWIAGGTFKMGSDRHYPEEAPAHSVTVEGFWIERHPVTNKQFSRFVHETGYVTLAERIPKAEDYPGATSDRLFAGSVVFQKPKSRVDLGNCYNWWNYVKGANWRHPAGPRSTLKGKANHPAVHVAFEDVAAYAAWAGKELPTEAEWEFAARGGLDGAEFAWGHELMPGGKHMANTWQGNFPHQNLCADGFDRTSPVTAFPPNGYGVHDMIGNGWEWTPDWWPAKYEAAAAKASCVPQNPRGGSEAGSYNPCHPNTKIPRKVIKGGPHLCAPNYCRRYRPAAR